MFFSNDDTNELCLLAQYFCSSELWDALAHGLEHAAHLGKTALEYPLPRVGKFIAKSLDKAVISYYFIYTELDSR